MEDTDVTDIDDALTESIKPGKDLESGGYDDPAEDAVETDATNSGPSVPGEQGILKPIKELYPFMRISLPPKLIMQYPVQV